MHVQSRMERMTRPRRLISVAACALVVFVASAVPANADGFEEFTVEEIGENTATCDFDGDGVFTDYWVTPEQTVLQKSHVHVDGQGITHVQFISIFDQVEYTEPTATPPVFYNSSMGVLTALLDGDTLLGFKIRGHGSITDADGNVLYQGPGNFDVIVVDGEPVDFIARGPIGPCVPGI